MYDEESSKAVQEVAKATSKGLQMLQKVGALLAPLGGIATDWANYLRLKNLCLINDKVADLAARRHLEGRLTPIPPGFILPLLDAASLECEDEVQDLWAALLTNAADPETRLVLRKVYIEILRGLQPVDVQVLKTLAGQEPRFVPQYEPAYPPLNVDRLAKLSHLSPDDVQVSLQTLARFGCVLDSWSTTINGLDVQHAGFRVNNPASNFSLSDLGRRLVAATSPGGT